MRPMTTGRLRLRSLSIPPLAAVPQPIASVPWIGPKHPPVIGSTCRVDQKRRLLCRDRPTTRSYRKKFSLCWRALAGATTRCNCGRKAQFRRAACLSILRQKSAHMPIRGGALPRDSSAQPRRSRTHRHDISVRGRRHDTRHSFNRTRIRNTGWTSQAHWNSDSHRDHCARWPPADCRCIYRKSIATHARLMTFRRRSAAGQNASCSVSHSMAHLFQQTSYLTTSKQSPVAPMRPGRCPPLRELQRTESSSALQSASR